MLDPVRLLRVMFTILKDCSKGFDPFCFRRPNTTVYSDVLTALEKQLALVRTESSDTSVPPQTCCPSFCKLAIHGHSPSVATELPPTMREFSGARPQTTGLGVVLCATVVVVVVGVVVVRDGAGVIEAFVVDLVTLVGVTFAAGEAVDVSGFVVFVLLVVVVVVVVVAGVVVVVEVVWDTIGGNPGQETLRSASLPEDV